MSREPKRNNVKSKKQTCMRREIFRRSYGEMKKARKMYYYNEKMGKGVQNRIVENIKILKTEMGLRSLSDLANALGIPRTTISDWINRERRPSLEAIEQLADFFQVSIDELFGREF